MSDDEPGQDEANWSDEAFCARVAALAAAQQRTVREVCKAAGLADDYLNKPATKKGRSIGAILAIARSLAVPLSELIPQERPVEDATPQFNPKMMSRLAMAAHVAAHLYLSLDSPRPLPTEAEAERIVGLITELLRLREPTE